MISRLLLICVLLSLLPGLQADDQFVLRKTEFEVPEVGKIPGYMIFTEGYRFNFVPPKNVSAINEDKGQKKISITAHDNNIGITLRVTTNSPGTLPAEGTLKNRA